MVILSVSERPPAGSIPFEPQSRIPDRRDVAPLPVLDVADNELLGILILVEGLQKHIPLLLGHGDVDLGKKAVLSRASG
jgi:hypothetical protein